MARIESPLGGTTALYDSATVVGVNNTLFPWLVKLDDLSFRNRPKSQLGKRATRHIAVAGRTAVGQWKQDNDGPRDAFIDHGVAAAFSAQSTYDNAEAFEDYFSASVTFATEWPAPMGFNPWLETGGQVFAGTNLQKKSQSTNFINGLDLNDSWILQFEMNLSTAPGVGRFFEFELVDASADSVKFRWERLAGPIDRLTLNVSGTDLATADLPAGAITSQPLFGLGRIGDSFQIYVNNNTVIAQAIPGKTFDAADTAIIFAGPNAVTGTVSLFYAIVATFPQPPI